MSRLWWFRSLSTTLVMLLSVSGYGQQDTSAKDTATGCLGCGACLGGTALMIAAPIVLILSVIIAFWIYKDAHRRSDPKEMLWAILGLFLNVIGLVYYLYVVRKGDQGRPGAAPPSSP